MAANSRSCSQMTAVHQLDLTQGETLFHKVVTKWQVINNVSSFFRPHVEGLNII
jgi:hypothetical protein